MTPAELLVVVGMTVAVYLPKVLPLVAASEQRTERLRPWLRYVAPAVLGALVGPAVVAPSGRPEPPGLAQLPFVVALVGALTTRKMVPSLGLGLLALAATAIINAR